ncbi:bifunctional 2-polyprenyl-6-hydroxyphenol methylase/3-demethylubiquinol 3-O-methyltransferase UbiG [Patulibacter sp.]|uniref:class I SAM-dependent methyltransferase n=1 Tax=Patulibacter sp. TaxID=1912859 RepID=UPI0027182BFD|nr:class I SAM-dependent methyltransferase [Patulibacter sp.]MDO9407038.1 class I SAM-dependent methyltransferase [Patulibacter sp.]
MSGGARAGRITAAGTGPTRPDPDLDHVRWHDLECGGYRADLRLWRTLADEQVPHHADAPVRVLDLGSGTGRVALDLASRGHRVLGVDVDPVFCAELRRRAAIRSLPAAAAVSDARELRLGERFGLILAPMQTVQLLDGPSGRAAFLAGVRDHLTPDGVAAIAMVEDVEPFGADEAAHLAPDMKDHAGTVYASRPVGVTVQDGRIVLDRVREIVSPTGQRHESTDRTVLDVLDADGLEDEGRAAGLRVLPLREVVATGEHVGSRVVMFGV